MELVGKYKNTIENKKTDRVQWKEKVAAWKLIEKEFNSRSGSHYRSSDVLRTKYENLKKKTKQNYACEKRKMYATGGGPQELKTDEIDKTILEILGDQAQGLPSVFDSDALNKTADDDVAKELIECRFEYQDNENQGQITSLKTGSNKNIYVTKKSSALSARKISLTSDKWQELAEEKCKLVRLQFKQSEEKHALEVMYMKEEHAKKMMLMDTVQSNFEP